MNNAEGDAMPSYTRRCSTRVVIGVVAAGLLGLTALLFAGCGKPPVMINKYILEYPSPEFPRRPQVQEAVKVDLFSVAQAINTTDMIYRPRPFQNEAYRYHRWRVNPGHLVTDFLLRDLRSSGLFQAIFNYDSAAKSRFVVEGGVEEFLEVDEGESWQGVLAVNVTLLDTTQEEITRRIVFQKNYRVIEPFVDKTPRGLADALSRAMQRLSAEVIADLYSQARKRLATPGGA